MQGIEFPDDWTKEDIEIYKDTVSRILAGLDQVRDELKISWQEVPWSRMREMAERIAITFNDFTLEETIMIGTWLMASARRQVIEAEQGVPDAPGH